MFTGIITATAPIVCAERRGKNKRVMITMPRGWKFKKGQSVSVDGICSTVVDSSRAAFEIDYMPTTLKKTTAPEFMKGRRVNLELPLRQGDRLDGHFVLGHVDGRAHVQAVAGTTVTFTLPAGLARSVAAQGSITVNGVRSRSMASRSRSRP